MPHAHQVLARPPGMMEGTFLSAAKSGNSEGGMPSETASVEVSSVVASTVRAISGSGAAPSARSRVHRIVVPGGRIPGGSRIQRRPAPYVRNTARRRCNGGRALAPAPLRSPPARAGAPPVDRAALPTAKGPARPPRLSATHAAFRDPGSGNGNRRFRSDPSLPGPRPSELRHSGGPVEGTHVERSSDRRHAALISVSSGTSRSRPATRGAPA